MELYVLVILLFSSANGVLWNTGDNSLEQLISSLRKTYNTPLDIGGHVASSISKTHESAKTDILNMLCSVLTCTEWSEWSSCGSVVGRYGIQNRTRECGQNISEICREKAAGLNIDTRRCMIDVPWCPSEFEYTRNGFCVKLFNETFLSWYDSQIRCKDLGGSLINIDSEIKYENVMESLKPIDLASIYAWIDGIKYGADDQWKLVQGSRKPVTFGSWYRGEHGEETRYPQCRCVIRHSAGEPFMWCAGNVCENRENFICEIPKQALV